MKRRLALLAALAVAAFALVLAFVPRAQDPAYHLFADTRPIFGVPNGWNVLSNAGFLLVAALGLRLLASRQACRERFENDLERLPYAVAFVGVALTAFGSAYYHLKPDAATLFWDRLPMTVVFMSVVAILVVERIDARAGLAALVPLVVAGAASCMFWRITGDLRPYVFVQYFPAVALPLVFLWFPARYTAQGWFAALFAAYAAAKVFEVLDAPVFTLGHVVSGHTLKHLAAAAGAAAIARMLEIRRRAAAMK